MRCQQDVAAAPCGKPEPTNTDPCTDCHGISVNGAPVWFTCTVASNDARCEQAEENGWYACEEIPNLCQGQKLIYDKPCDGDTHQAGGCITWYIGANGSYDGYHDCGF